MEITLLLVVKRVGLKVLFTYLASSQLKQSTASEVVNVHPTIKDQRHGVSLKGTLYTAGTVFANKAFCSTYQCFER